MSWVFLILFGIYGIYKLFGKKSRSYNSRQKTNNNFNRPPVKRRINTEEINIENIKLSEEQENIFNKIENSNEHFFITGKAGTGKSVLLQYLKYKSKKRLVVGAFTGVAALNVGAQTLHSLFGLPFGFIDIININVNNRVATLMRHIDAVVIDEVSMVRADMMGAIDVLLRQARHNDIPFGGVQIIMFGDPYQLPPVVGDEGLNQYFAHNHGGPYFFNADVWQKTKLNIFELNYIFRQKDDQEFKNLLNKIRKNELEEHTLSILNKRHVANIPTENVITLATRNSVVDTINTNRLNQISSQEHVYRAEISGHLESSAFPTEEFLKLKKGAQVMLLKNDTEKRWVNGTVGIVDSLSPVEIKVKINKGNGDVVYSVPHNTWTKIRYYYDVETRKIEEEVLSTFTQFPLRLAWAFTIHKSQGKTYNSVVVNMQGGAFAHGQTYVALSRCTSLEGLYLTQPIEYEDIKIDPVVVNFMNQVSINSLAPLIP